jgi:S1-C subfamily serine protease
LTVPAPGAAYGVLPSEAVNPEPPRPVKPLRTAIRKARPSRHTGAGRSRLVLLGVAAGMALTVGLGLAVALLVWKAGPVANDGPVARAEPDLSPPPAPSKPAQPPRAPGIEKGPLVKKADPPAKSAPPPEKLEIYYFKPEHTLGEPTRNVQVTTADNGRSQMSVRPPDGVIGYARPRPGVTVFGVLIPGSTNLHVIVNRKLGYTTLIDLQFLDDAVVDLPVERMVKVDRPGVRARDKSGTTYVAREMPIGDRKLIVLVKHHGPAPAPAEKMAATPAQKLADRVKASVALIEGKYGHGSGFLVRPNVVATNSHVVLSDLIENVKVRFSTDGLPDDKGFKARLLYEDKGRDLVLLVLDEEPGRPALPVASKFETTGRPEVYVVGNPGQSLNGMTLANVVAGARCDEEVVLYERRPYYRITFATGFGDIRIGPGNSGGPAVDRNGEVIGIVTLAEIGPDRRPAGRAYCIPSRAVQDALAAVGPDEEWEPRIKKATARHTLDLAAINLYAHTLIGFAVMTARTKLTPRTLNPLRGLDWLSQDKDLIKAFQKADKRFLEIGKAADRAVFASKEITPEQRRQLWSMQSNRNLIRSKVQKKGFLDPEYRQAEKAKDQCRKTFDAICKQSGMSTKFSDLMLETVLREAGINVQRR